MAIKEKVAIQPQTVEIEMTLSATVQITQEILDGIAEQYPDTWKLHMDDPEEIAKLMLFASVGDFCSGSNAHFEDVWDGVGNMQGLITEMELF